MFTITKKFTADLAHRVHNQTLDPQYCENGDARCVCRALHGHTVTIDVTIGSNDLLNSMVLDYKELGFVKDMVKQLLDHHFLISFDDPLFNYLITKGVKEITGVSAVIRLYKEYNDAMYPNEQVGYAEIPDVTHPVADFIHGTTIVNFTTTSENLARWIFHVVQRKIVVYNQAHHTDIKLLEVGYSETAGSRAVYKE